METVVTKVYWYCCNQCKRNIKVEQDNNIKPVCCNKGIKLIAIQTSKTTNISDALKNLSKETV